MRVMTSNELMARTIDMEKTQMSENGLFLMKKAATAVTRNGDMRSALDMMGYMLEDIEEEFDDRGNEFLLALRDVVDEMINA